MQTQKGSVARIKTAAIEFPGDPSKPGTFIDITNNEQKLGAYIGFTDVALLRRLAISWPVLKAFLAFEPIEAHMSKRWLCVLLPRMKR